MTRCTLPDFIAPGLDILSIGINPSTYSVERGFPFARPGNRFWPALNASGLVSRPVEPSLDGTEFLLRRHRIGFTDLVKRPTARASDLSDAEFRRGVKLLRAKLERHAPAIAWFQGVSAYRLFLAHAGDPRDVIAAGLQPELTGATRMFVTPNPSGANPGANLKLLVPLYRELGRLRDEICRA